MPSFVDIEVPETHLPPLEEQFETTKVFPLIHTLKEDVMINIDSALSWDQLTAADVNFTLVRPLVFKYAGLKNLATVYACLVVRAHFLRLSKDNLAHTNLNNSRAMFCQLMAIKLLRHFANTKLELVAVLTHSWNPFTSAPHQVVEDVKSMVGANDDDLDEPKSALEIAIATDSKTFLATSLVQAVVNDIYSGRILFSTISHHSLVADNYKQRQIEIYDYRTAPFLNHYRLRVPKYGVILEMANFAFLLLFFMLCLANKELHRVTIYEGIFCIFALAFALEEYTAFKEHGRRIYMANMWNVFDTSFITLYFIYLAFRIKGITQNDDWFNDMSFDILACGACILFPRLAFFAVSNSVVVLSIRAMIADFFYFVAIAAICFSGLLFTLWELAQMEPGNHWTVKSIAWLMTQIWFGNTSLSFAQATSFHPFFGPILMVIYSALSNTLLLTILVSILTNTFARIDTNATEEHLFQFTISTIEGVQSDALFSYQPPFNLLAYVVLAPLSCFVSPRTLHSVNVLLIRITSFPILVVIAVYERYLVGVSSEAVHAIFNSLPRQVKNVALFEAIVSSASSDPYDALFEVEVPLMDIFGESEVEDATMPHSFPSRDPLDKTSAQRQRVNSSLPSSPRLGPSLAPDSPGMRSRSRSQQRGGVGDPQASPLARIFNRRLPAPDVPAADGGAYAESIESALEGLRRVERTLEGLVRLRGEVRELQEQQARIESLLMTLTRGMRGEGVTRSGTH